IAFSRTPSPASRLLQVLCESGIPNIPSICRSRLAGDGDFKYAIASKVFAWLKRWRIWHLRQNIIGVISISLKPIPH
ncbi:hypothetical protein, partial [Pseudomonas sp. BF-B-18]|uniref:hypothetical protein n=1 Tax=Pseudomonas sp. BF-B-18 TaxID=2832366 RepID=UPI001CC1B7F2